MTRAINLTSKEWLDLIFASRNQIYGAYKIRKTSSKRHLVSLVIVILLVAAFFAFPVIIKNLFPPEILTTPPDTDGIIIFHEYNIPEKREIIEIAKPAPAAPAQNLKATVKFTPPVITKDIDVPEGSEMPPQIALLDPNVGISIVTQGGVPGGTVDPVDVTIITNPVNPPVEFAERMPQFIGGDKEMMSYLGRNIKYPMNAQERNIQGTVVLRFVVDKDGNITDVTVLRSLDSHCDKEAIRVVKSMPRWIPGEQNGTPVAVYFTIPVKFKLNS